MAAHAADRELSADLLEVLVPLLGVVHSSRTLSPGKVGVLRLVSEQGRASAVELTKAIGVSQQAISLTAKELEAAGLLTRHKDEQDKRRTWFHLTAAGADRLAAEIQAGRAALQTRIDSALSGGDDAIVRAALPMLRRIGAEVPDED